MSADATVFVGRLEQSRTDLELLEGYLVDCFGWRLEIRGLRDPKHGGWCLTAHPGPVPPGLRQPAIDDEVVQ